MKIGLIGLGKMGANMTERLLNDKHEVVVYNLNTEALKNAVINLFINYKFELYFRQYRVNISKT